MNAAEYKAKILSCGFNSTIFRKSALNIRDGAGVFDHMFASGQYRTVLEIGTYRGVATGYIAQFCDKVITIDLAHGKLEQNGERFDRHAFWKAMGADNIDLVLVKNAAEKAAFIKSIQFDLAFIDGGKIDIAADFASVRHCGTVLFHDYDYRPGGPHLNHVYDFVNSLPKEQVEVQDIFALWKNGSID